MREYQKTQYWQEETMGEFFQKFGEGVREYLTGGKKGEFLPEIWRRYARISKGNDIGGRKLLGEFSKNLEKIFANFKKHYWTIGGRKLWGNFSRSLEKICANCPQTLLAGGNYGVIFPRIWRRCARISKNTIGLLAGGNYGGIFRGIGRRYAQISEATILAGGNYGGIFQKFGADMREFPKHNIGGANYGAIFYRNLEKVCVNFKAIILAGGNYGGIFYRNLEKV